MDPKSANRPKKETHPPEPPREFADEKVPAAKDRKSPRRPSRPRPRKSDS